VTCPRSQSKRLTWPRGPSFLSEHSVCPLHCAQGSEALQALTPHRFPATELLPRALPLPEVEGGCEWGPVPSAGCFLEPFAEGTLDFRGSFGVSDTGEENVTVFYFSIKSISLYTHFIYLILTPVYKALHLTYIKTKQNSTWPSFCGVLGTLPSYLRKLWVTLSTPVQRALTCSFTLAL
jgi:hypothetical protein